MTFKETQEILDEIRKYDNLVKFQSEKSKDICKQYSISETQLNFLLSVIAAERIKKKKIL
jgi:hypothetical protein